MKHDDVVGEAVCEEEALEAQKWATAGITGQNLEDLEKWANPDGSWRFAGSQPVSHDLLCCTECPVSTKAIMTLDIAMEVQRNSALS